MSSLHPSATLRPARPSAAATVASTTASLSPGVESHPALGRWYCREYGLGPRKTVRLLARRSAPENRHAAVRFRTASGTAPVEELSFSSGGALAVAGGPRVGLFGGAGRTPGTSDFLRALKAGSAAQQRRDAEEEEEEVDLFGGKLKEKKGKTEENLDDIDADRNINTGGLMAACAAHRSDGKLIAVGTEGGFVRICDANSRATLRTFNSSKHAGGGDRKAIRSVAWLRDGKRVIAGGDDAVVRVWNVSGGMKDGGLGSRDGADITLRGHGDKVTSVKVVSFRKDDQKSKKRARSDGDLVDSFASSDWGQLVVSGSYDHTIRAWDIDSTTERGQDRCVSIMDHGDPIQALLVLPPVGSGVGGSSRSKKASKLDALPLLVSAGGTTLKVWNPLNGSCLGTFPTKHAKTITSLCLLDIPLDALEEGGDDTHQRKRHILTAGLDGLLRIHSASNDDIASGTLPFIHGMQLANPISAVAISRDMSRLAIGTTTGIVAVHQRRRPAAAIAAAPEHKEPRRGTQAYFMRGAHEKPHDPDDYLLPHEKKRRLAEYDVLLRKFRYGDALDAALAKRQPQAVVAVIEELGKRRGLTLALSNRDEDSLDAILSFTTRFINQPEYTPHLVGVAHILCDIYGSLRGQSAAVDELFARLGERVAGECSVQKMLLRLLGQIDFVMAAGEIATAEDQGR
ncbi:hypothetical protein ACHAXT_010621 [Thalassiosira profunda]